MCKTEICRETVKLNLEIKYLSKLNKIVSQNPKRIYKAQILVNIDEQ